jgi:hypothetical protein
MIRHVAIPLAVFAGHVDLAEKTTVDIIYDRPFSHALAIAMTNRAFLRRLFPALAVCNETEHSAISSYT